MRPDVTLPDPETAAADLLDDLFDELGETVTVGFTVPDNWTKAAGPHAQVAVDLVDSTEWPVYADCTVRITVMAAGHSEARRLALLAQGVLTSRGSVPPFARFRPLTGPLSAVDPAHKAPVASVTVRATVRSEPFPVGS